MDNVGIMAKGNRKIVLIVHNVRSAHNVGSLMRTAEGLGINHVYLSGYTPYPKSADDKRLPHISQRATRQINKTALGAEDSLAWSHTENIEKLIQDLRAKGYEIIALEQTPNSKSLVDYKTGQDVALIVGSEIGGLDEKILGLAGLHLQIPMLGAKESFNVANAGAIALYHLRFQA